MAAMMVDVTREESLRSNITFCAECLGRDTGEILPGGTACFMESDLVGETLSMPESGNQFGKDLLTSGRFHDDGPIARNQSATASSPPNAVQNGLVDYTQDVYDDPNCNYGCPTSFSPAYQVTLGWRPPSSSEDRQETLDYFWTEFLDEVSAGTLTREQIAEMIIEDNTGDYPGLFWTQSGGDFSWGPVHWVFADALRMIDIFRSYIPDNEDAEGVAEAIQAHIHAADTYQFELVQIDPSGIMLPVFVERLPLCPSTFLASSNMVVGRVAGCSSLGLRVQIDSTYLTSMAAVADAYLFHAHRVYHAYKEGALVDMENALSWFADAKGYAKLALGAISHVASSIIHELVHYHGPDYEEDSDCASARISLRFNCRVASLLGLYAMDPESGIDGSLEGKSFARHGLWSHWYNRAEFTGSCKMRLPGRQSPSSRDWTVDDDWSCDVG